MGHPAPHRARVDPPKCRRAKTLAFVALKERKKPQHIGTIGLHGLCRPPGNRAQLGQPAFQRIPETGLDHSSQRRIARSKTPPMKSRRSVPWLGEKCPGESEAKANIPGNRFGPKSSAMQASERTQLALPP